MNRMEKISGILHSTGISCLIGLGILTGAAAIPTPAASASKEELEIRIERAIGLTFPSEVDTLYRVQSFSTDGAWIDVGEPVRGTGRTIRFGDFDKLSNRDAYRVRQGAGSFFVNTAIFEDREDGYPTQRIPALIVTERGSLLAFCEGRATGGDSGDIDVIVKRSDDGGRLWSEASVVWSDGGNTCGNPTAVLDADTGRIWLMMNWNHGGDGGADLEGGTGRDTRRVYVSFSDDDGYTWANPAEITSSVKLPSWNWYAVGPGHGIQAKNGRLLFGCNHSEDIAGRSVLFSHIIFSDDHGETWQLGGQIPLDGTNECTLVEASDGLLLTSRRLSGREGRSVARSHDGGLTWNVIQESSSTLIDSSVHASMVRFTNGTGPNDPARLLFANPADREDRRNLTVRLSYDEGESWPVSHVVNMDYSGYSDISVLPDQSIGVLYETHGTSKISFAKFNLDWITDGGDSLDAYDGDDILIQHTRVPVVRLEWPSESERGLFIESSTDLATWQRFPGISLRSQTYPWVTDFRDISSGEMRFFRFGYPAENAESVNTASAPTFSNNLAVNGDFEVWSSREAVAHTFMAPPGWTIADAGGGGSIVRETAIIRHGASAAKLTRAGGAGTTQIVQQRLVGDAYIQGREYVFSAWVNSTVADRAALSMSDGITASESVYHRGDGVWRLLTVSKKMAAGATLIQVGVQVSGGPASAYFDAAMLTEGPNPFAFADKPVILGSNPDDVFTSLGGDLILSTEGRGLQVKEGSDARMGTAVLGAGTVTVANITVTANTRIFVSRTTASGRLGHLSSTLIPSKSFTIKSSNPADSSTVNWLLIEPSP